MVNKKNKKTKDMHHNDVLGIVILGLLGIVAMLYFMYFYQIDASNREAAKQKTTISMPQKSR